MIAPPEGHLPFSCERSIGKRECGGLVGVDGYRTTRIQIPPSDKLPSWIARQRGERNRRAMCVNLNEIFTSPQFFDSCAPLKIDEIISEEGSQGVRYLASNRYGMNFVAGITNDGDVIHMVPTAARALRVSEYPRGHSLSWGRSAGVETTRQDTTKEGRVRLAQLVLSTRLHRHKGTYADVRDTTLSV